jgi:hypothetical protein
MPRISIDLSKDEFARLSDRAFTELRHPRDEARMIVREGLGLPRTLPPPPPLEMPRRGGAGADRREGGRDAA